MVSGDFLVLGSFWWEMAGVWMAINCIGPPRRQQQPGWVVFLSGKLDSEIMCGEASYFILPNSIK